MHHKWEQTRASNFFLMCLLPLADGRTCWYNIIDNIPPSNVGLIHFSVIKKETILSWSYRWNVHFTIFFKGKRIRHFREGAAWSLSLSLPAFSLHSVLPPFISSSFLQFLLPQTQIVSAARGSVDETMKLDRLFNLCSLPPIWIKHYRSCW